MRFLIDANLPRSALPLLRRLGHEAQHVRDLGLGAAPDEQIAAHARASASVVLTRDLDFSDIRRYPPANHAGLIVLRLPDDAVVEEILRVVERFLSDAEFVSHLPGRLAVVEPSRVRFRPPLARH